MLTKISIENFKAVGDRIEIPIRPLTLLFGANSAGKSTILHAIHYAWEILERQHLDVDKTMYGSNFVSLGGFSNFIHGGDLSLSVCLRFDFEIEEKSLKDYLGDDPYLNRFEMRAEDDTYCLGDMYYQFDPAKNGWVELNISYSQTKQQPYLKKYSTGINGELIADIYYETGRPEAEVKNINFGHSIFNIYADFEATNAVGINLVEAAFARCGETKDKRNLSEVIIPFKTSEANGALPVFGRKLELPSLLPEINQEDLPEGTKAQQEVEFSDDRYVAGMTLTALLTQYMVATGELLKDYLNSFRYIGPWREKPERNYEPPRYIESARWANGLAAWDVIYAAKDEFIKQVGNKLVELETGYTIQREDSIIIPKNNHLLKMLAANEAFDLEEDEIWIELNKFPTMRRISLLPTETSSEDNTLYPYQVLPELILLPQDVGEGVSQVFPIIVACLDSQKCFLAIEQPELHLHPRQQAGLGDILIEAKKNDKTLFIETHSEHLILRLLRRIRESASMENPPLIAADLSVIYVEQKEGKVEIFNMEVDDKGEFLTPWPDTFFEQDFIERFAKDA